MSRYIDSKWRRFYNGLPHQELPYSKKNWGHPNHSLCSYQGKLKPAIAHHLVKTFVPRGGRLLDPFCGVGTIPFEGALAGMQTFGMDISPLAFYVSAAKVSRCDPEICAAVLDELDTFIRNHPVDERYREENGGFGFNKTLSEYYEHETFDEILAARRFFNDNPPQSHEAMLVMAALLHILHGNRPYALSRKSHPIVPYAPTGAFEYKNLVGKVREKVDRTLANPLPDRFVEGNVYLCDSTGHWPDDIDELDAIVTSPPFFDSTRFYLANWIRLWFTGWDLDAFNTEPAHYVEELQKDTFDVYNPVFEQARERLKRGGYFVMHLGRSEKCDMGEVLRARARRYFNRVRLYDESVAHCAKFGIPDLGSVTSHEYLIME